jgi:hypothetical protein
MYGGGFSTVPAYLADIFGTQMVGAIHGRLLTAWSVAGIVGPLVIAELREVQLASGMAKSLVYDRTLYLMAGLLFVGLISNLMVRPVKESAQMSDGELQREQALQHEALGGGAQATTAARGSFGIAGALAWAGVGVPFTIGLYIVLQKAAGLF